MIGYLHFAIYYGLKEMHQYHELGSAAQGFWIHAVFLHGRQQCFSGVHQTGDTLFVFF